MHIARVRVVLFAAGILTTGCSATSVLGGNHFMPVGALDSPSKKTALVVTSVGDNAPGSLRQAVAKAQDGTVITFHLPKHAKIILTGGAIVIGENLIISGPGAAALSISSNGKSQLFTIRTHKTVTISGLTFTKGSAAQGAALYNAGSLTLENDAFKSNTAPGAGGSAALLSASMTPFDPRHRAHNGRVPKHPAAPRLPTSPSAGVGEGGAIYNTGELTVSSCAFSGNAAGGKAHGSLGIGGAIAQVAGSMKISQSTFAANTAGGGAGGSWGMGGAIYVTAGSLALIGDTFKDNQAGGDDYGYGGAVYDDQWFSGSKNTFLGNAAYGGGANGNAYGGAVYAGGGLSLSGGTFSKNVAAGGTSTVIGYAFGGAIDSESTALLSSVAFGGNVATGGNAGTAEGGAIYLAGGTSKWKSLTFSTNSAHASGSNSFANGGAVSAFAALTISGATSFVSNAALAAAAGAIGGEGGAIAVEIGPFAFIGSASNNSATTAGGAFWIDGAATITNSLLSNNSVVATQRPDDGGGGIYVGLGGALTLTGSTLTANAVGGTAPYTGGGGIFNIGSGTVTNSTIDANTSAVDGGGIENAAQGGFALANVTVYRNTASGNGGGLKNLYGDASMTVANSIFAGGVAGGVPSDLSNDGTIVSGDYNIIESAPSGEALSGTTTHNLSADPQLSTLADNGGPTPTNADTSSSPGTAYIPFNSCLAVGIYIDQRGYYRDATVNGYCDVGAYEDQTP
jgi:fibronectin-binding autotransporter adhesin